MASTTPPPPSATPSPQDPGASAQQEKFREAFKALGYEFTSTTRIAGLPTYIVENMLEYHRQQYREYGHAESGATGGDDAERQARIELSYDMTCHWFKNVYAKEVMERPTSLWTDSFGDTDSAGSAAAAAAENATPAPATPLDTAASEGDVEGEVKDEDDVAPSRRAFWLATHPSDLSDIMEGKAAAIMETVLRAIRFEDADAMVGDDNDNSEDEMPALIPIPTSDEEDASHDLEIIGMSPTPQEVQCNCTDGKHLPHLRRKVFAFVAPDGTLVIQKHRLNLIPLEM
ncbi:hypothetical protein R3P38DRAFT_3246520 [Favolaschia claudopus]|uniref:Uncharacterized protein n=1 Tax=Favolaschia claudopus TaxID=2862362 RepID=A0AAV9YYL8_9AGAR